MTQQPRRLIEDWLPINAVSVESIRERSAVSALPPLNGLHVWWARRPLAISRAAVAAALLNADAGQGKYLDVIGTHHGIVDEQLRVNAAKISGERLSEAYSMLRAFTHNLTESEHEWFRENLVVPEPVVLDITAGGGSIPFETGRLGVQSIANELNPVAGLILRATCEWPQKYGCELLDSFQEIKAQFLERVHELTANIYPKEPQPERKTGTAPNANPRVKRHVWAYLFARTVACPSCEGTIPLSPNWRLDSKGTGIRLVPDATSRTCSFEIVKRTSDQSPGTVSRGKAICPYPACGATTPTGYISQEAQGRKLGHQFYCIVYRDTWYPKAKSGKESKRPKTSKGFRVPDEGDNNTPEMETRLDKLAESWERDNILPTEAVPPAGDKTDTLQQYGMPTWREVFSPRQLLAHGYCVQAFHDLVDEDRASGILDECRAAAWCYVALAIDKMLNRNSLLTIWDSGTGRVSQTFSSHDFGMKWSYAEMAIAIEGLGLEWALDEVGNCLEKFVQMAGHPQNETPNGKLMPVDDNETRIAPPTMVTIGPAQDTDLSTASVDAITFDPPYHNNVNYAELSDFFYVWLKRTAGYVLVGEHL